jgi:hypothetical protein
VNLSWLSDNETILHKLPYVLACIITKPQTQIQQLNKQQKSRATYKYFQEVESIPFDFDYPFQ